MPKIVLENILNRNKSKDFVKRIISPTLYPVLENEDGSHSTHSMAYAESDGRYLVYPTVVSGEKGLVRLSDDEAWKHALTNREYIDFDNEESAAWFSENYKKYWDN